MRAKYHIYLTAEERRVVINSLIDLRNNLISQGMYTDFVDELLIRISKAKAKKIKIILIYLSVQSKYLFQVRQIFLLKYQERYFDVRFQFDRYLIGAYR